MNANGMSYPAYHLGTQYFWNNLAERRRRPVAHLHHGHAVGAERALPGHGPGLAGREHRGEQRGDRAVRHEPPERRRRPASRSRARSTAAPSRRRTRCATTTPARLRCPPCDDAVRPRLHGGRAGDVLAGAPGRDGRRGAGVDARGRGLDLLEPGHPGLQRRRRPGLEHRREPVPVDGRGEHPGDADPAVRGRRHGVRAGEQRAGGGDDDAGGRRRGEA